MFFKKWFLKAIDHGRSYVNGPLRIELWNGSPFGAARNQGQSS